MKQAFQPLHRHHYCFPVALIIAVLTLLAASPPRAGEIEFIVSRTPPEVAGDSRNEWNTKLITLALELTTHDYGPYRIVETPQMNRARIWKSISSNRYPNLVLPTAYSASHFKGTQIAYIPFPVELGLVGYRVCFYPQEKGEKISHMLRHDLYRELTYGLHRDWEDSEILRFNGFNVAETISYDSLFKMTAAGRFDLFCRGISEIYDEYNNYKNLDGLAVEQSTAFHYEMPVFFWINTQNQLAKKRLMEGFVRGYKDGSLMRMFYEHYQKKIAFTKLNKRRIIQLENPLLEGVDSGYLQYNLDPTKLPDFQQ